MAELPTLTKRMIQAQVVGPVYREMVKQLGQPKASAILKAAITQAAVEEGQSFAGQGSGTSMADFIALYALWTADGALEIEVLQADDHTFDFNVTRCKYAEYYRDSGLGDIGHLLSCQRDGSFCQGYNPRISLKREKTLMAGDDCCTFRYLYKSEP